MRDSTGTLGCRSSISPPSRCSYHCLLLRAAAGADRRHSGPGWSLSAGRNRNQPFNARRALTAKLRAAAPVGLQHHLPRHGALWLPRADQALHLPPGRLRPNWRNKPAGGGRKTGLAISSPPEHLKQLALFRCSGRHSRNYWHFQTWLAAGGRGGLASPQTSLEGRGHRGSYAAPDWMPHWRSSPMPRSGIYPLSQPALQGRKLSGRWIMILTGGMPLVLGPKQHQHRRGYARLTSDERSRSDCALFNRMKQQRSATCRLIGLSWHCLAL